MSEAFPFPLRVGYAYSLTSLELAAGPSLFDGISGFSVTPEIDGEAIVYANGILPFARTHGRLKVMGSIKMVLDPAIKYVERYPNILSHVFPAITAAHQDGARRDRYTLTQVRLLQFPSDFNGPAQVEVDLKFTAFNFLLNGNSLVQGRELGASNTGV